MKRIIPGVFLALFLLAFSGCTTEMQKHLLNSRFHQAAQYFERNMSPEKAELDDL